mmetsp:Transcript_35898/g.83847  ORF Transcript_35898/g.83847 Transcript_35898/m.83847 type:complete len:219 (+) Transcript_35898:1050-1706(+)
MKSSALVVLSEIQIDGPMIWLYVWEGGHVAQTLLNVQQLLWAFESTSKDLFVLHIDHPKEEEYTAARAILFLEQIQHLTHLRRGYEDVRGHASQSFESNFRDGAIPPGQQLEQLVEVVALHGRLSAAGPFAAYIVERKGVRHRKDPLLHVLHRQAPPRIGHVPEMTAVAILRGIHVCQTLLNPRFPLVQNQNLFSQSIICVVGHVEIVVSGGVLRREE